MNKKQNWPALNTPILAFTEACGRSQQKMEVGIMESLSHLTSEEGGGYIQYICYLIKHIPNSQMKTQRALPQWNQTLQIQNFPLDFWCVDRGGEV